MGTFHTAGYDNDELCGTMIRNKNVDLFVSVQYIPIGAAETTELVFLLIFVPCLEALFLGEKITGAIVATICTAIAGLFLIYQPDFGVLSKENNDADTQEQGIEKPKSNYGLGLGIMAITGVSLSICIIARRLLTGQSTMLLSFYLSLIGISISIVPMFSFETITSPSSVKNYICSSCHILFSVINNVTFLEALKYTHGYVVAVIFTTSIPMMLCCQYTILRDIRPGHENVMEVIGAIIVTMAAIFLPLQQLIRYHISQDK